jgi:hypothetical protein
MNVRGFVTRTEKSAGAGEGVTCTATDYAADNTSARQPCAGEVHVGGSGGGSEAPAAEHGVCVLGEQPDHVQRADGLRTNDCGAYANGCKARSSAKSKLGPVAGATIAPLVMGWGMPPWAAGLSAASGFGCGARGRPCSCRREEPQGRAAGVLGVFGMLLSFSSDSPTAGSANPAAKKPVVSTPADPNCVPNQLVGPCSGKPFKSPWSSFKVGTSDHIVLGLRANGLEETATNVRGCTLLGDQDWMATLQKAAADPGAKSTVTLDGSRAMEHMDKS